MNAFLSDVLLHAQEIKKVVDAEVASTKIKPVDIHNKANNMPNTKGSSESVTCAHAFHSPAIRAQDGGR